MPLIREVADRACEDNTEPSSAPARVAKLDRGDEQPPPPVYQGLPAKFTLPNGMRESRFSQELLRTDRPQRATIFAVSAAMVNWLGVLIALVPMAMLWRERRRIID